MPVVKIKIQKFELALDWRECHQTPPGMNAKENLVHQITMNLEPCYVAFLELLMILEMMLPYELYGMSVNIMKAFLLS